MATLEGPPLGNAIEGTGHVIDADRSQDAAVASYRCDGGRSIGQSAISPRLRRAIRSSANPQRLALGKDLDIEPVIRIDDCVK